LNIYPINAYMAEHWIYFSSIGFFLMVAEGVRRLQKDKVIGGSVGPAVVGLICLLVGLTVLQNRYWRSPIVFYETTLKYAPKSVRMHNGLALAYYEAGRPQESIAAFKKGIEALPEEESLYNNLGAVYLAGKDHARAQEMFLKAIEIDPRYAEPYNNLVAISLRARNYEQVREYVDKAQRAGVEIDKSLAGQLAALRR
jgi:Tfp pilus assembly protein PilF